jgi:hypothetical protein
MICHSRELKELIDEVRMDKFMAVNSQAKVNGRRKPRKSVELASQHQFVTVKASRPCVRRVGNDRTIRARRDVEAALEQVDRQTQLKPFHQRKEGLNASRFQLRSGS